MRKTADAVVIGGGAIGTSVIIGLSVNVMARA